MKSCISRPLALALFAIGSPCLAQATIQPIGVSDADALAEQVRRLSGNPLDLDALLTAGELSLRLDDLSAAGAFFSRAEKIDPRNARAKAGEGALILRNERPGEALRLFAQAEQMGLPSARFAADRGLAYDLIGDQPRAAREYRAAMAERPDAETRRRYALSLAIAGKQAQALDQLAPLIRQNDRAAWRSRAFILAMGGDMAGAAKIAQTMMPPGSAAGLQGFFAELPHLPAIDRAFAVHFGEVHPTAARFADARLAPVLAPLPAEPAAVQVAARVPDSGNKRKKDKRDKRDRTQVAALIPVPAPVEPPYQPPAYQPPAYQPGADTRVAAVTPRYPSYPAPSYPRPSYPAASYPAVRANTGVADRQLTAGELASLGAAAGSRVPRNRALRAAPPATPGFSSAALPRPLTPAEQASLAVATIKPRSSTDRVQITAALPTPAPLIARVPSITPIARGPALGARVLSSAGAPALATSVSAPNVANAPSVPTPMASLFPSFAAPAPAIAAPTPSPVASVAEPGVATASAAPTGPASLAGSAATPSLAPAALAAAAVLSTSPVPTAMASIPSPTTPAAPASAVALAPQPSAAAPALATLVPAPSGVVAAPTALAAPVLATSAPGTPATAAPSVLAEATAPTIATAAEVTLATPGPPVSIPLAPLLVTPPAARLATARSPRTRGRTVQADSILAKIVANLSIPASELGVDGPPRADPGTKPPTAAERRAARRKTAESLADQHDAKPADRGKLDKKALAAKQDVADKKAAAAKQAAEDKKAARDDRERIWVQVAGGANDGDLAKAWSAVRKKAPGALGGKQAYTTPLRATNRVLTGPFKTDAEARAYVNQLAKTGVSAFTFTSDAGQKVTRLPTK